MYYIYYVSRFETVTSVSVLDHLEEVPWEGLCNLELIVGEKQS